MLIKYKILKHILLKHFRNITTHINIRGIISSTIILQNTKIALDNKKIFLSNGEYQNFIINMDYIQKIKIVNIWHIILKFKDFEIDIQQ